MYLCAYVQLFPENKFLEMEEYGYPSTHISLQDVCTLNTPSRRTGVSISPQWVSNCLQY